jgi:hypothetical protein
MDVPATFSQRRAAHLLSLHRTTVAAMLADGRLKGTALGQVTRESAELYLGRRLTAEDWNGVTILIQRAGMENA